MSKFLSTIREASMSELAQAWRRWSSVRLAIVAELISRVETNRRMAALRSRPSSSTGDYLSSLKMHEYGAELEALLARLDAGGVFRAELRAADEAHAERSLSL